MTLDRQYESKQIDGPTFRGNNPSRSHGPDDEIMPTTELIDSFAEFAKAKVEQAGNELSIDDLFDDWRLQHPSSDDWLAVKASLRDLASGESGRPFDEFAVEFRQRNGIRETP